MIGERRPLGRLPWSRMAAWLAPVVVGALALAGWDAAVKAFAIEPYILPGPGAVLDALRTDGVSLLRSLAVTMQVALSALLAATILGGGLAILFAASPAFAAAFFPWAVMLQVTPIVAIAPLVIIWVRDPFLALLVCALVVAFFPIVSNTTAGLRSADRNLVDLFRLYGAGAWQTLWLLRTPAALPFFLAGLRISGGLALIGAVVAEFVAGSGGTETGLAYRILESGYRLQVPKLFAALALLAAAGVAVYAALSGLTWLLLHRWHDSAAPRDE